MSIMHCINANSQTLVNGQGTGTNKWHMTGIPPKSWVGKSMLRGGWLMVYSGKTHTSFDTPTGQYFLENVVTQKKSLESSWAMTSSQNIATNTHPSSWLHSQDHLAWRKWLPGQHRHAVEAGEKHGKLLGLWHQGSFQPLHHQSFQSQNTGGQCYTGQHSTLHQIPLQEVEKRINRYDQKMARDFNVKKLQILLLFEADFNANNKWIVQWCTRLSTSTYLQTNNSAAINSNWQSINA